MKATGMILALTLGAIAAHAQSNGSIVLAPSGRLFTVNPDSGSVSVVDTVTHRKVLERSVGKDPRMLALSPDSRYLYVTSQGSGTLRAFHLEDLAPAGVIQAGAEPYGVVTSPAGDVVYVAASASAAVEVIRVNDSRHVTRAGDEPAMLQVTGSIAVEVRPKGLAISPDGSRLYVTHFLSGDISVIDTSSRKVVTVISTGADSNMAQRIVLSAATGRAYVPHIRSNVVNPDLLFDGTVFPELAVIDLVRNVELTAERADLSIGAHSVNLPFDAVLSRDGTKAYVVNLGSGELSVVDLKARYRIADVDVGDGPRGIALSADGGTAYVTNSLSDDVSVVDLNALQEITRIKVTTSPLSATVKRGKLLFYSSRSSQVSRQRWMSCASCHLEGDMDGRTWQLAGIGPRNTVSLRGASATGPFHWDADSCSIQDVAEFTIRDLMGGSGLIAGAANAPCKGSNVGVSSDLDALAAFCAMLAPKVNPVPQDTAAVARGKAIFNRVDVGCAVCHVAPLYTDSAMSVKPFIMHNVGTGGGPGEVLGPAFDTPSLLMLWNSAPYLHDGSAATLMDVLTKRNPLDQHGRTSILSEADKADLVSFLMSL